MDILYHDLSIFLYFHYSLTPDVFSLVESNFQTMLADPFRIHSPHQMCSLKCYQILNFFVAALYKSDLRVYSRIKSVVSLGHFIRSVTWIFHQIKCPALLALLVTFRNGEQWVGGLIQGSDNFLLRTGRVYSRN